MERIVAGQVPEGALRICKCGRRLSIGRGVNDKGLPVGVANAKRLLEELPNKVRDKLVIMPEVAVVVQDDKEFVRITVLGYPSLVSYNGKFYYRSGNTVQILNGNTLQSMLLARQGMGWDAVTVLKTTTSAIHQRNRLHRNPETSGKTQQRLLGGGAMIQSFFCIFA